MTENYKNICICQKNVVPLSPLSDKRERMAGWMSDLVGGLQNRIERFDSATGLHTFLPNANQKMFVLGF